ncbi:MAG TPA: hypothetical protein VJJ02_04645 [Candidatus Paceibacterota bacterium]
MFITAMINLLPEDEKKKLTRERRVRLGVVMLWCVFALEMLTLLFFTPAYYVLYLNTEDLTQAISERRALTPKGTNEAQASLAKIKKEMALLQPSSGIADVLPSVLFGEVVAQKPQGVTLNVLTYTRATEDVTIQLSGIALVQEDLLAFRRNVKTNPRVVDFKYGSSFITKKTDIDFNAVITFR